MIVKIPGDILIGIAVSLYQQRRATWFVGLLLILCSPYSVAVEPLRVVVVSDLNGSYGSTKYGATVDKAITRVVQLRPALVISTGDMVAGQRKPHLQQDTIEHMWHAFHKHISDPLGKASIPFAVTPGNHDASAYSGFGKERRIYLEQWSNRRPDLQFLDDSNYPFYYAFSLQGVLFVSLDATVVGPLPDVQRQWLKKVLEKHADSHHKRVVFSHIPLWPTARGREREFMGDQEFQVLLEEHKVNVFLSGHHHAFYPGGDNGVAYISQSCLGAGPRALIGVNEKAQRSFTVLDISDDSIEVAAYVAPNFTRTIDWKTLPTEVRSTVSSLQRLDMLSPSIGVAEARQN